MQVDPYPITIEKMKGFLALKTKSNRKYSTLANYIASFSYYFRSNNLDILTNKLNTLFSLFKIFIFFWMKKNLLIEKVG